MSPVLLHFWGLDRPGAKPKGVEQAVQQAGLVTFDDSNGWLWLPDGKFLPRAHAAEWKRFVKDVRKGPRALPRADLLKDLEEAQVRRLLEPHGWVFGSWPQSFLCQRVLVSGNRCHSTGWNPAVTAGSTCLRPCRAGLAGALPAGMRGA